MSLAFDNRPLFSISNMSDARIEASENGKLILVDFCASWCKPCQWMEKTTYSDSAVKEMLSTNFVTVKIDIDEMQGFELKKLYEITYLPTLLIFNSQGELLCRIEKTLSPHKLLETVEVFNIPDNKRVMKHGLNKSPLDYIESKPQAIVPVDKATIFQNYSGELKSKPSYKVQVGVFTSYEVAEDMIKNLRKFFAEPVTVSYDYQDNIPVFKIRLGQFDTREGADNFKIVIKNDYNMDGIVI